LDGLFFKGIKTRIRNIITKYNLVIGTDFVFYNKKNGVIFGNPASRDRLYLNELWMKQNIPFFMDDKSKENKIKEDGQLYKYEMAPELLELTDEQKFKDENGNIFEVEVRGERNENNCWFLASDIGKLFGINDVRKTIENCKNNHINEYKFFTVKKSKRLQKTYIKLFLNYDGVLHLVYSSYSKTARKFRKWATNTLFTVQLGTVEQKKELCDKILGNDLNTSRKIIKSNNNNLSAIYLLTLGYVKDLRDSMNLDERYKDDMIVYGRTNNLYRRLDEHKKTFQSIKNVNPMLKFYCYIDANYASNAETLVKDFFKGANKTIKYKDFDELVVIDNKFMENTKKQYYLISSNYVGTQHDTIAQIKDLEKNYQLKIKDYEYKLLVKQSKLNEALKDNEILQLKLQLAQINN
jgi:hypothetical protein